MNEEELENEIGKIEEKWEKEIGADKWSVWDSITTEQILLFGKYCFQKGKLEQKKEELSFMKECGINDFKNIEEADSSGFEKEFRRLKQLQKEIGGKE